MREFKTEIFQSGVHNKLQSDVIPQDAAQDALSWVTTDGHIELSRGRQVIGAEESLGKTYAEIFAPKKDGTLVHFRKIDTKIQYYDTVTELWVDIITGLTAEDYTFASYISLAGAYVFAGGVDGLYKIGVAHPTDFKDMYLDGTNHKGKIIINDQRMFMWDRRDGTPDKTGLYLSTIDPQGTNYTTVTNEVLGASGSTTYTGTVAQATGLRFVFGFVITGTTGAGLETFTDDFNGTLTGNLGGTGTINYATGAYSVTFNGTVTSGNVEADYQYEDSNSGGITDFTFTTPTRVAGEGDIIAQEYLGEPIQNVLIFEGKYYSLKETSTYELNLTIDDTNATNLVYRTDIGIPSLRAAVSTGKGMVFMNTANQSQPTLSILQKNPLGDNLEPIDLTPQFAWEDYVFDECVVDTWDKFIVVAAKTSDSSYNNRFFLINTAQKNSVDIFYWEANTVAKDGSGNLFVGSSLVQSTYQIFSGFDDLTGTLENYYTTKYETYQQERLKRFRYLRLKGKISKEQYYEVYALYDNNTENLIGTVRGDGDYVDLSSAGQVGSSMVGDSMIGGGTPVTVYDYFVEIRMRAPKFRMRALKFVAKDIGYVSINYVMDLDILLFRQKLPSKYRLKQHVSLDGNTTDVATFDDV